MTPPELETSIIETGGAADGAASEAPPIRPAIVPGATKTLGETLSMLSQSPATPFCGSTSSTVSRTEAP